MSSIGNLAGALLHAVLPINLFPNNTTAGTTAAATSPATQLPDTGQLSSFAQIAATLQQLQQSNPVEYTRVTQQIAAKLQSASQTAQSGGNTATATPLNQLATDFSNASASGQLPNLQDLASATGGPHGHPRHPDGALSQLLTSLQTNGTQSGSSTEAATIIQSVLGAG